MTQRKRESRSLEELSLDHLMFLLAVELARLDREMALARAAWQERPRQKGQDHVETRTQE